MTAVVWVALVVGVGYLAYRGVAWRIARQEQEEIEAIQTRRRLIALTCELNRDTDALEDARK